ncbi:carboxypeptidase-like regulatory domain-containing protein [Chitinophaga sedimenti]|uniref:carboxypeptidase-like regulatory domain-containing protein n=1 Tax=Chitinophaga sedimenti TaxID=2033606 RepID=UPI0020037367|nr:carboxypeptidase-like regulatory domain-containing protein [Chitinophaga sedimenti]MCK7554711.1 carboxypeptidase-like regulatory domain-containing protein [Chitinophaga sedimenti]
MKICTYPRRRTAAPFFIRILSCAPLLLLLMMLTGQASAQTIPVKGEVLDTARRGVSEATVQVKGTSTGVWTDASGKFTINASRGAILLISSVGYAPQEVTVNGESAGTIILKPFSTDLTDVVVVGFGTQKK